METSELDIAILELKSSGWVMDECPKDFPKYLDKLFIPTDSGFVPKKEITKLRKKLRKDLRKRKNRKLKALLQPIQQDDVF